MNIGFDAKRAFHNTTGLGNYSRDLISVLSKKFPSNKYFLYNPKNKKIDRLRVEGSLVEKLPVKKIWKKLSSIWRQGPIVKQLSEDRIDIFHGLSGEIPKGLKKQNIKSVVTIHDLIFVKYPKLYSFFDRKIHLKKHLAAAKNADKIIAISKQTKKDIVDILNVSPDKIEVIYQSCHEVFKSPINNNLLSEVINKYNLPKQFILNVSTIEKRKNQISIIKSIKNVETCLVLIGKKGDAYEEIKSWVDTNDMNDKVIFLSGISLEELAAIYKLATLFVFPSLYEGFGIPIIEAMYSKTPVITSRGGVFPEVGGPNSIYVNPLDISGIEKAITNLLNNQTLSNQIAETGYQFVQKFNDETIATSYMNVYHSIS